jgi:pimeloyl-ACP methyl ester carboxylesterase
VHLQSERTGSVSWRPCGAIECGSLSVPRDETRPAGAQITLALGRLPATGRRIGVLFTNPGGPGGSGIEFLRAAAAVFPPEIRRAFDIISWDPRGVGASAPVTCGDDLDAFYAVDRSPDNAGEIRANVDAARAFVAACRASSAKLLPFLSTSATASDMDAIRVAIGEQQITYVGFSYGTYLGALYAQRFPTHVRAMVLDGAVDPSLSYNDATVQQAQGFERQLNAFFDACRVDRACGFASGADPRAAFESLARDVDAEPQFAEIDGEQRTLGPGEFDIGVATALYGGVQGRPALAAALAQTAGGLGNKLLELSDQYTGRSVGGRYTNETAALYAIGCLDGPSPPTVAAVEQLAARATAVAPHFGAATVWLGLPCTFWPAPAPRASSAIEARDAPPIVVVGTTGDPATPYAWAQSLARQLGSGHLLTFDGAGHTAYGRGSSCIDHAIDRYLLRLTVPVDGTRCRAD